MTLPTTIPSPLDKPKMSYTTTLSCNTAPVPDIGPALTQLAEAIQTAKRAGMTCAEASTHMAIMWLAVPVEDRDDGGR